MNMTDHEITWEIALACGWHTIQRNPIYRHRLAGFKSGDTTTLCGIPQYLSDLNAIHEAEKVLKDRADSACDYTLLNIYAGHLEHILEDAIKREKSNVIPDVFGFEITHATARQRCEAFLKTIGKWK